MRYAALTERIEQMGGSAPYDPLLSEDSATETAAVLDTALSRRRY